MASVPVWAVALAVVREVEATRQLVLSADTMRALTADAQLYTAFIVLAAAPLAGVVTVRTAAAAGADPRRGARLASIALPVVIAVLLLVAVSASVTLAATGAGNGGAGFVAASHLTLMAVALSLAALGALCASVMPHPLDAAGSSLAIVLTAAGALFAAGGWVADLPPRLLAVTIAGNPLVAMSSSAGIDIVRMDLLYKISPLAHLGVDYPPHYGTAAAYLAIAAACLTGLVLKSRSASAADLP